MKGRELGKWPYGHTSKTLRLSRYLTTVLTEPLATPPATLDLTTFVKQPFPLDGNDKIGDCTVAAAAHQIQVWSAIVGQETIPTQDAVEAMYYKITGGPDVGAEENAVLTAWSQNPLAGWTPLSFLACDPNDPFHIKAAAHLFGGVYIGLQLSKLAGQQIQRGEDWTVPATPTPESAPGSWGGHAVNVVGYDEDYVTVVTWGRLQRMSWPFWAMYCDEAWAALPNGWEQKPGINWPQLLEDISLVAKA